MSAAEPSAGARVPVRPGLFVDDDPPALLCGRCGRCQAHHFPRMDSCPYCSGDTVDEVQVRGPGRLWAYTAVTAAPPGYGGEVPFGFGVVELPELRVVTRLTEPDPARLEIGRAMDLVVVPLEVDEEGRDVVTYAFVPGS